MLENLLTNFAELSRCSQLFLRTKAKFRCVACVGTITLGFVDHP